MGAVITIDWGDYGVDVGPCDWLDDLASVMSLGRGFRGTLA